MRKVSMICLAVAASFVQHAHAQQAYELRPGDVLEVWVAQDEQLNRSVTVGPDGRISLPLVGHISVIGATVEDVEQEIRERLKEFYTESVDLAIMMVPDAAHLPSVFVAGDVTNPGVFTYRPGMTVLHAVTLAGGPYREALAPADRDRSIVLKGEVDAAQRSAVQLSVVIAALRAELGGIAQISLADGVPYEIPEGELAEIVRREQSALDVRTALLQTQTRAATDLSNNARRVIESVRAQMASVETRRDLMKQRLTATTTLVERGLTQRSLQLEREQELAELDGLASELQVTLAEAETDLANEALRADSLAQERRAVAVTELNAAQRELNALDATIADSRAALSVYSQADARETGPVAVSYRIMRTVEGEVREITADRLTPLLPGDLVESIGGAGSGPPVAMSE